MCGAALRLVYKQMSANALFVVSCECVSKSNTEEKNILNEDIILVFFVHKKYSHSFIKLRSHGLF